MRVRSLCCCGWGECCGRGEPLQPMQLRWTLNPDQRNCEHQAQSKGLHGEGCERSPSPTGGVVPVAFECAEHNVSSGTGPLFRTDTCALRFDPERTPGSPQKLRPRLHAVLIRNLKNNWNRNYPSGVATVSAEWSPAAWSRAQQVCCRETFPASRAWEQRFPPLAPPRRIARCRLPRSVA